MFFIPLAQIESVELVIHSLKAAAGEADCSSCPASKVCMKQCLTIAHAIEQMFGEEGETVDLDVPQEPQEDGGYTSAKSGISGEGSPAGRPRLTLIKSGDVD